MTGSECQQLVASFIVRITTVKRIVTVQSKIDHSVRNYECRYKFFCSQVQSVVTW